MASAYVAKGLNVVPQADGGPIEGIVRYVEKPKDAVAIVREPDLSDVIVLSVGGAVTFVGTVLMKRPAALLTIEGAPESHLGILAREFNVPAIMSLELADSPVEKFDANGLLSAQYQQFAVEALNGKRAQLDIQDPATGLVRIA